MKKCRAIDIGVHNIIKVSNQPNFSKGKDIQQIALQQNFASDPKQPLFFTPNILKVDRKSLVTQFKKGKKLVKKHPKIQNNRGLHNGGASTKFAQISSPTPFTYDIILKNRTNTEEKVENDEMAATLPFPILKITTSKMRSLQSQSTNQRTTTTKVTERKEISTRRSIS